MRALSTLKRQYHFMRYNMRPFRPRLFVTHAWKRGLSKLGLRQGFRIIDLALTYECNLRCSHCSALVMKRDAPTLTLDDFRGIVREARDLDLLSWNLTGGEPLLVEWLDELIPILEPQRHYISIQTNCALLTDARARRLARLGVNCITTSLDSSVEAEHNRFRGSSTSYAEVLRGVETARRAGMSALVGATLTHQNLRAPETEQLIEQANAMGAILLFNLAVPCGRWAGRSEFILRGDDRAYLLDLMDRYPMTSTDHEVGRNCVGCPAGVEKVYITPYGDVIPCPFIHVSFGNVRETPLTAIVQRMREVPRFGKYQDICVAAEDEEFQQKVMARVYDGGLPRPAPYERVAALFDD
jgi:MoaA/NifB/PqqE/SkfB family radical SAM enzyme